MNFRTVDGRNVVPLRLLPFASHWLTAMTVAQSLAHKNPNEDLKLTGYYRSGDKLVSMRAREWDALIERMLLLERTLQEDEKTKFEDANFVRYTSESRAMLPADVVVDCDEIKAAYFKVFLDKESDGPGYLDIRPGDNDLDFNCYLSPEDRRMVFEGFEMRLAETIERHAGGPSRPSNGSSRVEEELTPVSVDLRPFWQKHPHDLDDMTNSLLEKDPKFYRHQSGEHKGKANKRRLAVAIADRINAIEERERSGKSIDFESIRSYLKLKKI